MDYSDSSQMIFHKLIIIGPARHVRYKYYNIMLFLNIFLLHSLKNKYIFVLQIKINYLL